MRPDYAAHERAEPPADKGPTRTAYGTAYHASNKSSDQPAGDSPPTVPARIYRIHRIVIAVEVRVLV